jgi:septin family protein
MEDIEHYNIPIYNFPYDVEEDDEDTIEENSELRVNITTFFFIYIFIFNIFFPFF